VRPYLEVKVVKVKKEEKKWTPDCCPCCGAKREQEKPKGNWVNGENLDKIKFPCFCSFRYCGKKYLGQINHCAATLPYRLINIGEQEDSNVYRQSDSLRELIKSCDIHILKGKIILFEEE